MNVSPALSRYLPAFVDAKAPFIHHYSFDDDGVARETTASRGEFWELARKAAKVVRGAGLGPGDALALCVSANRVEDLAFRLAAAMTGAVPVTVNWQADPLERIVYKVEATGAKLVITDPFFDREIIAGLGQKFLGTRFFNLRDLGAVPALAEDEFARAAGPDDDSTRVVIFTSGTTGQPKGVRLSYANYETNRRTFDSFLQVGADDRLAILAVNPLHHGNSTAMTDWALRRPGTEVHLLSRYSTRYWEVLARVASRDYDRVVAPLVSRHFDFLADLIARGRLPLASDDLMAAMAKVDFLMGSAPVGPTTVERIVKHAGRTPHVRFGATETCLQSLGTPLTLSQSEAKRAFERGWSHQFLDEPATGYWIGRPHPPYTEGRVVKSVAPGAPNFMHDCDEGEPGRLITRGGNVMRGYVNDPEATARVFHDEWYLGLGDVGFYLHNPDDGERDYYWMSRESALLIRGGANYAYDQINAELNDFVAARYGLGHEEFDLAVVGQRIDSEHDDSLCVTLELLSESARSLRAQIDGSFINDARRRLSKGARPDYLCFDQVPRNFKGAVLVPELKKAWEKIKAK